MRPVTNNLRSLVANAADFLQPQRLCQAQLMLLDTGFMRGGPHAWREWVEVVRHCPCLDTEASAVFAFSLPAAGLVVPSKWHLLFPLPLPLPPPLGGKLSCGEV